MTRSWVQREQSGAGRPRRLARWVVLAVLGAGCVLDQDDLCGPNQVAWTGDERCVCAEGFAYTEDGCVPCGEHEVASPMGCVCDMGYARSVPTEPCQEIPEGIGTPCETSTDCLNPAYPHCQGSVAGGYCTSVGCSGAADCSGGYACNLSGSPPFCQRPPLGAGTPCTADAECAGTEALFCDLFVSGSCLVRDCTVEPNDCFSGSECCDLSGFGLPRICIPEGQCQE